GSLTVAAHTQPASCSSSSSPSPLEQLHAVRTTTSLSRVGTAVRQGSRVWLLPSRSPLIHASTASGSPTTSQPFIAPASSGVLGPWRDPPRRSARADFCKLGPPRAF